MADFSSMFGAYAQPQQGGGMFGQQQSPLMQMMSNPQIMQMLLAGGNQAQGLRGMPVVPAPPPGIPEQYNATPGSVPGTADQNLRITPEMMRMLFGPRTYGI